MRRTALAAMAVPLLALAPAGRQVSSPPGHHPGNPVVTLRGAGQAASVQLFNCFDGPHGKKTPRSGQYCWQGGLSLSIPIQNHPPNTRWVMSSRVIAGVRYLELDDRTSPATDQWTVVFVGWVTAGPGSNHFWPFRNPVVDEQFRNWAVVEVRWSPDGHVSDSGCIDALPGTEHQRSATGPCSGTRQGGGDPHASFIVWRPGSRLNQVQLENASQGGNHAFCPTAASELTVGAEIFNVPAVSQFEHQQQWHIKPL